MMSLMNSVHHKVSSRLTMLRMTTSPYVILSERSERRIPAMLLLNMVHHRVSSRLMTHRTTPSQYHPEWNVVKRRISFSEFI